MAQLTQEQLEALIAMQDIGGMEDEQSRMLNLAQSLRQAGAGTKGADVGSNIARAAYGIGGAYKDYKAAQQQPGISDARQGLMARLLRGAKKPLPNVPRLGTPQNAPTTVVDEEELNVDY